jgi:hypothetical protein
MDQNKSAFSIWGVNKQQQIKLDDIRINQPYKQRQNFEYNIPNNNTSMNLSNKDINFTRYKSFQDKNKPRFNQEINNNFRQRNIPNQDVDIFRPRFNQESRPRNIVPENTYMPWNKPITDDQKYNQEVIDMNKTDIEGKRNFRQNFKPRTNNYKPRDNSVNNVLF